MSHPAPEYDVVIAGAGPGGSVAARELARAGAGVLLLDRATFPRNKVCGCCVNGAAVQALADIGLGDVFDELGAVPLHGFEWHRGKRCVTLPLPGGYSISRARFDEALVQAAVQAGAVFRDQTSVIDTSIHGDRRVVQTGRNGEASTIAASIVIDASGLAGITNRHDQHIQTHIAKHSYMGVAATMRQSLPDLKPGIIYMADGPGGYVGLVLLEDGQLDIAAAIAPRFVQSQGSMTAAVHQLMAGSTMLPSPALSALHDLEWRGTTLLTQTRTPPAAERLFLIGDAAGYVEPFTGEGIAWAIASARAVVPHVLQALNTPFTWHDDAVRRWQRDHAALLKGRQKRCRRVARLLRGKLAHAAVMRLLGTFPSLASPMMARMSRAFEIAPPVALEEKRAAP